jgi:hypothetical protein
MVPNTRLLVMGATHLGRGSEPEPAHALDGIVERVVGWQPDAIAIEVLPGEVVDSYARLAGPFAGMRVGGLPDAVACAEAVRELHDWTLWQARAAGADPARAPAERVIAWCAAYEPYSALLHARDAEGLPTRVREALDAVEARGDECSRVAGAAATRLRLERLHPFDDHGDWAAFADVPEPEHEKFTTMMWAEPEVRRYVARGRSELAEALGRGDLWPMWRCLNTPERIAESEEMESGLFLRHGAAEPLARKSLAGWRARNLAMAARLRSITGDYPSGRVLAIVGHAHKGPLETALSAGQGDLDLADIAELDRLG